MRCPIWFSFGDHPRVRGEHWGMPGAPWCAMGPSPRGGGSRGSPGHITAAPVLPAHAGVVPRPGGCRRTGRRAPRAREDGSCTPDAWLEPTQSAPRTRGWFAALETREAPVSVGPAHAGIVPRWCGAGGSWRRRPRARRGWFIRDRGHRPVLRVGLAHARMVLDGASRRLRN